MIVSSLKAGPGEIITVFFDNASEIRSTAGAVTEFMLFSGKELSEQQFMDFKALSENFLALEKASALLAVRPLSAKELKDKLLYKGYQESTADFCVEKLTDSGLLNDVAYAASVARHYASKGYGVGRVRTEFIKRGISRELWESGIEAMPTTEDKLISLIARRLKDPQDREEVRKVSAYLYRRGFSWNDIQTAMSEYTDSLDY